MSQLGLGSLQVHFIESGIGNDRSEPVDSVLLRFTSDPSINGDADFNGERLFCEGFIREVGERLKHLLDEGGIIGGVIVRHGSPKVTCLYGNMAPSYRDYSD